LLRCW